MEITSLVFSIISAIVALVAIVQAMIIRQRMRKETEDQLSFLIHLIVNSAADPGTVRRMVEDYEKAGKWRANVFRGEDGKYHLAFHMGSQAAEVSMTGYPPRITNKKKSK